MLLTVKQACSLENFTVVDNLLKTRLANCLRKNSGNASITGFGVLPLRYCLNIRLRPAYNLLSIQELRLLALLLQ